MPKTNRTFWLGATGILGFIGFVDAAYLTADHFLTLPLPCTFNNGCDTVLTSAYATIAGIPISLLGVLYYLFVLSLSLSLYTSTNPRVRAARLILMATSIGVIASAYLFYLQIAVIHALCMYCLGSATTTILLFISSLFLVRTFKKAS